MSLNFLNPYDKNPEEHNHDLNNNEVSGKCSKCGSCCNATPLPTTILEMERVAEYVESNNIRRLNRDWVSGLGTNSDDVGNTLHINLHCCFYDSVNKSCTIYPVRPAICREFKCSNDDKKRDEIKTRLHQIADYNRVDNIIQTGVQYNPGGIPKNITNFDLLIYGDIIPLVVNMQYFTGITDQMFNMLFTQIGCQDTYNMDDVLDGKTKNIKSK